MLRKEPTWWPRGEADERINKRGSNNRTGSQYKQSQSEARGFLKQVARDQQLIETRGAQVGPRDKAGMRMVVAGGQDDQPAIRFTALHRLHNTGRSDRPALRRYFNVVIVHYRSQLARFYRNSQHPLKLHTFCRLSCLPACFPCFIRSTLHLNQYLVMPYWWPYDPLLDKDWLSGQLSESTSLRWLGLRANIIVAVFCGSFFCSTSPGYPTSTLTCLHFVRSQQRWHCFTH